MNDSSNVPAIGRTLRSAHARVRLAHALRASLAALSRSALALAAVIAAGVALPLTPTTATARAIALGIAVLACVALAVRAARRSTPHWDGWLERLESAFPDVRSWLRNAVDLERTPPAHGSAELIGAVRAEAAQRLQRVPLDSTRPALGLPRAAATAAAALVAVLALAGFAPERTLLSWRSLGDPSIAAPPVSLGVEPGHVTVSPGATLAVRARVEGTAEKPRLLGAGASPAPVLEADANGVRRWRFDLPPVTQPREYAVRVAHAESPRYRIALAGEPRAVSFNTVVTAPAYARLPDQAGSSTSGDLAALRGSRVRVEVTFDRDLDALRSTGAGGAQAWQSITPRRWRGTVPVASDGAWTLEATAPSGSSRATWSVRALADAPPIVLVASPESDTDLPAGQAVPYDVLVQDDLGLGALRLQWRKDAAEAWHDVPAGAFRGEVREARVASAWDASALGLLPGESAVFRFEVTDQNSVSGPGRAVSPEFRIRFPSLAELYRSVDEQQERAQTTLEKVAEQAREQQKRLEQLERNAPRAPQSSSPRFERSEEMRKALERQQALAEQLEQAAEQMQRSLEHGEEREAFREQLQQKMQEMSQLMREIQSQELKDAMKRMQEALQRMDARSQEQALKPLADQNKDMLKNLERSIELLKQLRDEERLEALSRRAEELKERQDALNREHAERAEDREKGESRDARREATRPDASQQQQADRAAAEQQREAAERSQELAQDAREAAKQTEDPNAKQDLEQAANELSEQAASEQQEAAEQSESGQPRRAQQRGQQASESLQSAAQRMSRSAQREQSEQNAKDVAALRRAAQDLVSLQQASRDNLQSNAPPSEQADRQTDLAEGVARVADSLSALGKQTPLLSPQAQRALGRAMQNLQQSGRDMTQGNRMRGEQAGQSAQSALNEAVLALRESESSMCQNPGTGQQGQNPQPGQQGQRGQPRPTGSRPQQGSSGSREQMGQLGREQQALNQRSRELARKMSQQLSMQAGDEAEMRRLADEQARLRAQLEGVQRSEQEKKTLLGQLDQTQRDMQRAEELIRSGRMDEQLEQQQIRVLSRLLDAQRSLNRRDFDPEREARRGEDVAQRSAPELPAALLRADDRLRQGLLKAGADRYPAQYRPFVEAYLRSLNGSPR